MPREAVTVAKFGGSSLSEPVRFQKALDVVRADERRRFVVVSAPGKRDAGDRKVTDMLYACYEAAQNANEAEFTGLFEKIKERFETIRRALCPSLDLSEDYETIKVSFRRRMGRDYAASRGEYLNGKLAAACLGYAFVDPADCVFFKDDGAFDAERTNEALHTRLSAEERAVIPGFYGSMPNDTIRTFTRGGSDVTGAIVARAVDALLYENWTDVDGFLMADPHIVDDPKLISTITYHELRELSYMGATVLHEDAVLPVRMAGIPILIKNTEHPEAPGTMILPRREGSGGCVITGIAGRKGFSALTVEKDMMNCELGFVRRILEVFEEYGINFEHMPTGIDGVTLVAPTGQLSGKRTAVLAAICRAAKPESVEIRDGLALIAVVGSGMGRDLPALSKVFEALASAGIPVLLTNRSMAENNVIVGVDAARFEEAIRAIYAIFEK